MIKIRKLQERYETRDGRSFRVHNYGKISLNEVLPKSLRTGKKGDEVQFNEKIKLGESNPTMAILRVPSNYKSNPNFNRDIESSFKATNEAAQAAYDLATKKIMITVMQISF